MHRITHSSRYPSPWGRSFPFAQDENVKTIGRSRVDKHMAGIQAGRYVQAYGLRLLPELYEAYNPMPYEAAREMEVELAIALREQGYGVWQA